MTGEPDLEFAARLKDVVKSLGGDDSVAELLGVHPKTVEKYRRGKSELKLSQIVAIAEVAGLSVQWLATGEGPRDAGEAATSNVGPALLGAVQQQAQRAGVADALDPLLVGDIVSTYQDALAYGLRKPLPPRDVGRMVIELHQEMLARRRQGEVYSINEFFHRVLKWPDEDSPQSSDCSGSPRVA